MDIHQPNKSPNEPPPQKGDNCTVTFSPDLSSTESHS